MREVLRIDKDHIVIFDDFRNVKLDVKADLVFADPPFGVTSSPRLRMGLPPELGRRGGGGVAEIPAFNRGFTHIGHICWFGAGHPAFRLAEASPPRLLPP